MSEKEKVEDKVRNLHFKAGAAMHDRVLGDVLKAHDKSRNVKSAEIQASVWRTIMQSKVTKLAAAAVIIVGVLIGIKIYSGWGSQPGEDMAKIDQPPSRTPTVVKEDETLAIQERELQPTVPEDDLLPEDIKVMLAADDFDGVAAAVAQADLRTKVATANFLANMDDGVKALEVLDNLSAAHSADEPDNPFAAAAERLRNRITVRQNVSNAGPARGRTRGTLAGQAEPVASAVQEAVVARGNYGAREFEDSPDSEERTPILFGTVVDERGSAVTDARVFASYALHGRTDANGGFALFISPTDGSNSMGPGDLPIYVWAWRENDPYRVAWTLIRQLRKETTQYPITEATHQGVNLVIEDESELAQHIPGDAGELFDEPEVGLVTEGIVLQMGPAGAIMGRVTDASGASVANATVRIEEFTLGLGMNILTVNNLNHEWKADVSTITDAHGYYQLSNLPISWTSVRLRAVLEGYGAGQAEYEGAGLSSVRGCDVQLTEGQSQETSETQDDDRPYRGEQYSDLLQNLPFSIPRSATEVRIDTLDARGEVSVAQLPSEENNYELVVTFDDGPQGSSVWYDVMLHIGSTGGSPVAEFTIHIRAYIDGVSNLVFKDNTAYWHHLEDAAPGRHESRDYPTYINDIEWFPEWSRPVEAENRSVEVLCGAVGGSELTSDEPYRGGLTSELLRDLPFSLPQGPLEARIEPVQARGEVSVAQLPSAENGHKLVVRFDDASQDASDWYDITLHVGSSGGSPTQEFSIGLKAYIDGVSDLVLSQNTVYWHHLRWVAPGLHGEQNYPTYINDIEWYPEWPRPAEAANTRVRVLGRAVGGFALSSSSDDSSEDDDDEDQNSEPGVLLSGSLIDERGNAVAGARVFGSYAHHGTTDANGSFALDISPEDGSNSSGPADFPMYVWAYQENDPYRVAWTLIRNPASAQVRFERTRSVSSTARSEEEWEQLRQQATQYPMTEETHQGVGLVVEDENDLAQYIPGDPGRLENPNGSPTVHDIVLVMGPATVITGRVTDANGSAVAGATVSIDRLQMQLGKNTLTISNLDHEWKAEAFALTDAQGYYQLNNLPASWTTIELKAEADGYATARQEFQNAGGNKLDGCDLLLVEAEQQDSDTTAVEFEAGKVGMGMYGGYPRASE